MVGVCGRYVSSSSAERLAEHFGAALGDELAAGGLPPSYNVAPTNDVYGVVASDEGQVLLRVFHWGLVPVWAKDAKIGSRMINARAETLASKSAFRTLFTSRRCIVPMDGFYEWQPAAPGAPLGRGGKPVKQPMYIHAADGRPLAVAGLWTTWRDRSLGPDAPWLHSCTVITTDANELMASVHDRMPAVLTESEWHAWLDPDQHDVAALSALLHPAPEGLLVMHRVSTDVNSVRNKGPELIQPVEG